MSANVLPAPSTTTIRTITKGAFIADLAGAGPETLSPLPNYRHGNEPQMNAAAACRP
jgi:hypothetical protein